MRRFLVAATVVTAGWMIFLIAAIANDGAQAGYARIVRKDPAFDKLVPRNAQVERIAGGFAWVEGPVWNRREGLLLFSDIPENSVLSWKQGVGARSFLMPSGYSGSEEFPGREPGSNGLTFDAQGRLVLCEHGDRRISRIEKDRRRTVLADRFEGKRLNSPNDLTFRSNGDLYFTDPPFGLPKWFEDPAKQLPFSGVYRMDTRGRVTLVTSEIRAPNGITFSPDERTLYVSNADEKRSVWLAYDVKPDGSISNGRVFFDATGWPGKGNPDGMKTDLQGNIYAAGPGGLHVFSPSGKHLGSFLIQSAVSNCAWGEDGSTLYITASTAIYRTQLSTKGRIP